MRQHATQLALVHHSYTTAHRKPNRRPYTTICPFFTQRNKQYTSSTCSFTHESPFPTIAHNRECSKALKQVIREKPKRWFVHATRVPKEVFPQCSFTRWSSRSVPPRHTRRSIPVQNAPTRSHTNPERGQLALKPVDVFGPSAPRTHVAAFSCPVAASGSCAVCAHRCALPPAVSPLGRAPCSVALPSLAG